MTPLHNVQFLFCEYNINIKRTLSRKLIQENVNVVVSVISKLKEKDQLYWISNLILLAIQKRALRLKYGEGERLRSYWMLIHLYHYFPKSVYFILRELPYIGYWGDLNNIYKIVFNDIKDLKPGEDDAKIKRNKELLDNIVDVWCIQIDKDKRYLNKLYPTEFDSVSFMGKWLPREKSSLNKQTKVINHILKKYDPLLWSKNRNETKKNYRAFISGCNKRLDTTEILMCNKSFSYIDFHLVPRKCLYKCRRAWSDETENGKRRHPNNTDRNTTRDNYLEYINNIESNVKESKKLSEGNKISILDILNDKIYNPYRHLIENANEVGDYFNQINVNPYYNENYLNNYINSK